MRKAVLIFALFIFSITCCLADYTKYYEFDDNLNVKFIPSVSAKDKEYKKILKNEKYMQKGKYKKAEKLMPDYLPNIARLIYIYTDSKDFPSALKYAKKLVELDKTNIFPKASKDYRLGILYSQNGDYISSNNYLYPYINQNMWARFQMAQNYYYMQDLKNAENYAGKIPPNDSVYLVAQELLYSIYNITKNPQKAYTAAKILVKLDPGNPDNYMKVAYATTNNDEKLINLYRAKQIFYSQNLSSMIVKINDLTAPLEQKRIDEAYKKITSYCKKPDWFKVKSRNENLLSGDITYWDRRQSEFFETANDCIKRYSGSNLAACFKDLNDTQEHLDATLAAEQARREEAEQREIQIRQLVRQNMLLEEQNLIQWSRYNSFYPRYYRHPYWW